jgi:RNA polymerase sigma factor (TIGR02999 family)
MPADCPEDITGLLVVWSEGDEEAIKDVGSVVYPELRRVARQHLRHRAPNQSLESAALAHEMYLKMIRAGGIRCENRAHFFALCAQMIRRILVDHARHSRYAKGGGDAVCVPLDEVLLGTGARGVEVLALDDALSSLAQIDPRQAQVVEMRFFGWLSVGEAAEVLKISPQSVMRDWKLAKAWLRREIRRGTDRSLH